MAPHRPITERTTRSVPTPDNHAPEQRNDAYERACFEAWAKDWWPNSYPPDAAWIGWQARAVRTPANSTGQYYSPDGTLMNPDGTRSIFDDVDK